MKKIYTFTFVLVTFLSFGQTFTATYDFSAIPASATNGLIDPTPPPVVSGLTFGTFTAINSNSAQNSAAGRFSYINQPIGAVPSSNIYTDHIGTIDLNTYFTFTVNPVLGTTFDLSKITFKIQRSGTGIRTYAVRSSVDGYNTNLPASINPINTDISVQPANTFYITDDANTSAENGSTITLNGANFTGISTPITFRIYGWNAESSTGTFSVDDVTIIGTTTTLSIKQNKITELAIYPNPVTAGILNITSANNESKSIAIFDLLGKQVLNTVTSNNTINVSNVKTGVYILKITEEGKTATRKLIIE